MNSPKSEAFVFTGGTDFATPDIAMPPGKLKGSLNVELRSGVDGIWRVDGIERTDGHAFASSAAYKAYKRNGGTGSGALNEVFTGSVSGATLVIVEAADLTADTYIYVYVLSGTPILADIFTGTGGGTFSVLSLSVTGSTAESDIISRTLAAQSYARSLINAPAGSGPVRGVCRLRDVGYCFRDNAGETECVMFKETSAGWVVVTMGFLVEFSANTNEPSVGETLTQGADTGIITGIVKQTGGWGTGNAAGYVVLSPHTGTFGAGAATTATATLQLTAAGEDITLNPGGRYEFKVKNFTGEANTEKMYWVDGKNRAFEYDGTSPPIPIHVNNLTEAQDKPDHIEIHQFRLMLGYSAGSIQISGIEDPKVFDVITTSTYFDPGEAINGLRSTAGDVMLVFCPDSIRALHGNSSDGWSLKMFAQDTGASKYSVQGWRELYFLDGSDIMSLATTQAFGDFKQSTISSEVKTWLDKKKDLLTASILVKKKSHYRLFFSDDTGLTLTFDRGKISGITFFQYPCSITCTWFDGDYLLGGSDDGIVYRLDSGNSFDGEAISGFWRNPYYPYGDPRVEKQFMGCTVNFADGTHLTSQTDLKLIPSFDYGRDEMALGSEYQLEITSGGGYWSQNSYYGDIYYSSDSASDVYTDIEGAGVNMSLIFDFSSSYDESFMVHSVIVDYLPLYMKP